MEEAVGWDSEGPHCIEVTYAKLPDQGNHNHADTPFFEGIPALLESATGENLFDLNLCVSVNAYHMC